MLWSWPRFTLPASVALAGVLAACSPAGSDVAPTSGAPQATTRAPTGTSPKSLTSPTQVAPLAIAGLTCEPRQNGIDNCSNADYDVSGSDAACADGSSDFGVVQADGADVVTTFTAGGRVRARLPANQLVCIQYSALSKSGGDAWSYVTAIPASVVPACKRANCPSPAGAVTWRDRQPGGTCAKDPDGRYTAACASGWVRAESIDAYSMGLEGQHADAAP